MTENIVYAFCDGASRNNGQEFNVGAWSFILKYPDGTTHEYSQVEFGVTNNQMELNAILKALQTIKNKSETSVVVMSYSKYSILGITEWSKKWIMNGWKTVDNKTVKNEFYWKEILVTIKQFKSVTFQHIKGHSGHPENEKCDMLCNQAMDKVERKQLMKG